MLAAWKGSVPIVMMLLDRGSDVSARDNEGITALKQADRENHPAIVVLLRKAGAKE
jgi:ankyrin repeat protein